MVPEMNGGAAVQQMAISHAAPVSVQAAGASSFRCLLDEQPTYLVPYRLLADDTAMGDGELVLNPECWIGQPPRELLMSSEDLPSWVADADLWVRDPATGIILPFWMGATWREALSGLQAGEPAPRTWPQRMRVALQRAGVLMHPEQAARARTGWRQALALGAEMMKDGYARLGGLIHPYHIGELRRHYRSLLRHGVFTSGDDQSARRAVFHNEPVARFFHQQLAPAVSQMAGEAVKPSYAYVITYREGAELASHVDREQCEYTITLAVDQTPEPSVEFAWPLHLETDRGRVTVFQAIGDALLFRGRQLPHGRDRLAEGCTSTSILFHYVPAGFEGPLD
jgi:hypothetical protein